MAAKKGKKFFKKEKPEVGNSSVNPREKNTPQKVGASVKVKTNTVVEQRTVQKKRPYFPSISRSITEDASTKTQSEPKQPQKEMKTKKKSFFSWKWVVAIVIILIGLVVNLYLGVSFYRNVSTYVQLALRRNALISQMNLWQSISQKYPDYRDAYMQGAILAYELGNSGKEAYFLQQIKIIDPNYPWIKTLEQLQKSQ